MGLRAFLEISERVKLFFILSSKEMANNLNHVSDMILLQTRDCYNQNPDAHFKRTLGHRRVGIVSCETYRSMVSGHALCGHTHILHDTLDSSIIAGLQCTGDLYVHKALYDIVCLYRCHVTKGAVYSNVPVALIGSTAVIPARDRAAPLQNHFEQAWKLDVSDRESEKLSGIIHALVVRWLASYQDAGKRILELCECEKATERAGLILEAAVHAGVHSDLFTKLYTIPITTPVAMRVFQMYTSFLRSPIPVAVVADLVRDYLVGGPWLPAVCADFNPELEKYWRTYGCADAEKTDMFTHAFHMVGQYAFHMATMRLGESPVPEKKKDHAQYRDCAHCGKNTRRRCPCQQKYFCSTVCQKRGWRTHKASCLMRS